MNPRRDEIAGYHRVKVSIWSDPDFTSMTPDAQLVYFLARCSNGRRKLTYQRASESSKGWNRDRFDRAYGRLRQSPYSRVLDGRSRRDIPTATRREVMGRDRTCRHCGTDSDLTLDHIIPYSKGGPDTVANLQVLCRGCNTRKGAN